MADEDYAAKSRFVAVEFTQLSGVGLYTTYRRTNWTSAYSLGGNSFTSLPGMSVQVAANSGSLDQQVTSIEFPLGVDTTLDSWVDGDPIAPVWADISFVFVNIGPGGGGASEERIRLGRHRLVRTIKNPEEQRGIARLEFLSPKNLLNAPLGIMATPRCAWTLGDKTCGVSLTTETGTVASVDRKTLTLTDPADSAVVTGKIDDRYWHRGFIRLGGLSIGIRDWDGGGASPYSFQMIQAPPSSWAGEVVTLTPGCDKTAGICESRWSNLEQFGGFGIAIPTYHPVLETT